MPSWPGSELTAVRTASLRTLVSSGANEATSGVILMIGPVITAFVFTFALAIGLLWVDPGIAVLTVIGGLVLLGALRAGMHMETRAEEELTRANDELDDRLFEFAFAQPSLRCPHSSARCSPSWLRDAWRSVAWRRCPVRPPPPVRTPRTRSRDGWCRCLKAAWSRSSSLLVRLETVW